MEDIGISQSPRGGSAAWYFDANPSKFYLWMPPHAIDEEEKVTWRHHKLNIVHRTDVAVFCSNQIVHESCHVVLRRDFGKVASLGLDYLQEMALIE